MVNTAEEDDHAEEEDKSQPDKYQADLLMTKDTITTGLKLCYLWEKGRQ